MDRPSHNGVGRTGWAGSLQESDGAGAEARWDLPVESNDTYTISAWWPAAPQATNWNTQARFEILTNGGVLAATNLDQTANGDQWHEIATVTLTPNTVAQVRLTTASGICVADALLLRSQSRYNNGRPAARVRLQPMDAILLQRDQAILLRPRFGQWPPAPECCANTPTCSSTATGWNVTGLLLRLLVLRLLLPIESTRKS